MTARETTIEVVDLLAWAGSGAVMLVLVTLAVLALWRGQVVYGNQKLTKLDNPIDYLFVLAVYFGCIYFLWPKFWAGLSAWGAGT
jgi:hypothetical protein